MGRTPSGRGSAVLGLVLTVLVFALVVLPLFADRAARAYRMRQLPLLFYEDFEADGLLDYSSVLGVAHNSGNSLEAMKRALDHSGSAVEIDVVSHGGVLYAAHRPPVRWIGSYLLQPPTLERVWEESESASMVKLDLKESSGGFVDRVIAFLEEHPERQVAVSSPYITVLEQFREEHPQALRMLSVSSLGRLQRLLVSSEDIAVIHGVTIRHDLLSEERMRELQDAGLLVNAWTVNDFGRLNELVEMGVDAVTTDNLAITELLGGGEWLPWDIVPPE